MKLKKTKKIIPVLLSGGSGERLWPISSESIPKQFLPIPFNKKKTLFQDTIERFRSEEFEKPIIICSEKNLKIVKQQIKELNIKFLTIICENKKNNTAPAICLVSLFLKKFNFENNILVTPTDQKISSKEFSNYINSNEQNLNHHVLFGLKPSSPKTNLGYIGGGKKIKHLYKVETFVEKPCKKKAETLINKNFFWNSGIFLLNPNLVIEEFKKYKKSILDNCLISAKNFKKKKINFTVSSFKKCPNISFDKCILEKSKKIAMEKVAFSWQDLGTWEAIWEISKKDSKKNFFKGNIIDSNVSNCLIISDKKKNFITNVKDLIIVIQDNSVLIKNKEE